MCQWPEIYFKFNFSTTSIELNLQNTSCHQLNHFELPHNSWMHFNCYRNLWKCFRKHIHRIILVERSSFQKPMHVDTGSAVCVCVCDVFNVSTAKGPWWNHTEVSPAPCFVFWNKKLHQTERRHCEEQSFFFSIPCLFQYSTNGIEQDFWFYPMNVCFPYLRLKKIWMIPWWHLHFPTQLPCLFRVTLTI